MQLQLPYFLISTETGKVGYVGIGTTSPSEKLDVIGGALAAGNGTIRTGITYSTLGLIGTFTNHDLGIITNGTTRLTIASTGITASVGLEMGGQVLAFNQSGTRSWSVQATGGNLRFQSGDNLGAFSFGSNVGIGTTSPTSRLEVFGGSLATAGNGINFSSQLTTGRTGTYEASTLGSIHNFLDNSSIEVASGSTSGWVSAVSVTGNNATLFTGTVRFITQSVERMRITSNASSATLGSGGVMKLLGTSGAVGVYTELQFYTYNAPTNEPPVSLGIIKTDNGGYENGEFYIATKATNANTAPVERMRITSGGALCLGVTSAYGTNLLNVNGGIYATSSIAAVVAADIDMFVFQNTGATYSKACVVASMTATGGTGSYFFYGQQSTSTVALKIFSNGNIQNTNNSYGAISDARLKENIIDATPKLDDLMKVKVRNYNLKGESNKQLGVISQELEAIFPNMIEESTNIGSDVKIKGVKYSVFVPMLIKAVQELKAEIEILKNK